MLGGVDDDTWWSELSNGLLPISMTARAAMLLTVLPGDWTGVAMSRICRMLRRMLSRNNLAILAPVAVL